MKNLIKEHEKNNTSINSKKRAVLKSFKFKRELHSSAREIQIHLEKTMGISAQKPELKLRKRIKRYKNKEINLIIRHLDETGEFAESISLGYITPLNILINVFINDGIKSKNYRKNLLHQKYSHIGIESNNKLNIRSCYWTSL